MTAQTRNLQIWLNRLLPYVASVGLVAVASGIAWATFSLASSGGLTLVFLVAVVISANRFGLWPAVLTSVLGVLAWDYFFTIPYYHFYFDDPRDVFALVAFLMVSLTVSGMTAQIQGQNERLSELARSITRSYELSQALSQFATIDELASYAARQLTLMLGARVVLLIIDRDRKHSWLTFPAGETLSPSEQTAAESVLFPTASASKLDATDGDFTFLSFDGSRGRLGCVAIAGRDLSSIPVEERRQMEAFLAQVAIAIERAWLTHDMEHARMITETERLRNALLTSVSHDLRTPLTTIIGALSTLRTMGSAFSPAIHKELLTTARNEAERLNRFIGNLLDITRLEAGTLEVPLSDIDLEDVIDAALERANELLAQHKVQVEFAEGLPEVRADFALLEQVFFNLLDNAAKYSPLGSTITLRAVLSDNHVVVTVCDEGRGIPAEAFGHMFEKFARFDREDSVAPGTGLGLMVCRGFLTVMGGTISAANRSDRQGAIFTVTLNPAAHD